MSDQFLINEEIGEILPPEETKKTCNKKKFIIIAIISILVVVSLVITLVVVFRNKGNKDIELEYEISSEQFDIDIIYRFSL